MDEQHDLILKAKEKEYADHITELKISNENEIEKIKTATQQTCKTKDEEISRLEKIAEEQCDRYVKYPRCSVCVYETYMCTEISVINTFLNANNCYYIKNAPRSCVY